MSKAISLYRNILRVHRRLPQEMRFVGDQYVRAEFRNHRRVTDKQFLDPFFAQWTSYLSLLKEQTQQDQMNNIGKHLDPELVERFDDDKAEQLLGLHKASTGANSKDDSASDRSTPTPGGASPPKRT